MSYENPEVPHEVNVSHDSPVLTFIRLSATLAGLLVVFFALVYFALRFGAQYIPFSFENHLGQMIADKVAVLADEPSGKEKAALIKINALAKNLASHMGAPADMPVYVHIMDDPTPNAFATLGGHIMITQGLIDKVHSENALAMVIAHELAHVKNRDVLVSAGVGITFAIVLAGVTSSGGEGGSLASIVPSLMQLTFSRKQESKADADGLKALRSYYKHSMGAEEFFQLALADESRFSRYAEFLQTHPDTEKRLLLILASQNGDKQHTLTPLPPEILAIQCNKD